MEHLVRALARRYEHYRAPFEDLCQEGRLGVLKAFALYDPHIGPFMTFAFRWAQGHMLHYIRDNATGILELDNTRVGRYVETRSLKYRGRITGSAAESELRVKTRSGWMDRTSVSAMLIETLRLMVSEELTAQEIAVREGVSVSAIRSRMCDLYNLWQVKGIIGAYNKAMRDGLIEPPQKKD